MSILVEIQISCKEVMAAGELVVSEARLWSALEKFPPRFLELCATQQHFSGRVLENFPKRILLQPLVSLLNDLSCDFRAVLIKKKSSF